MAMNRRDLLALLGAGAGAGATANPAAASFVDVTYQHGVASGDPLQDRVVLWTRLTPMEPGLSVLAGEVKVASDAAFT